MRVTSKGQVTIPQHIRDRFGLLPETEVQFEVTDAGVLLRKVSDVDAARGRRAVESLRGRGTLRMSTDEIMALMRGDEDGTDVG